MDQHEAAPPATILFGARPSSRCANSGAFPTDPARLFRDAAPQPIRLGPRHREDCDAGLTSFIRASHDAMSVDALFAALVSFGEEIGCPWVAYAALSQETTIAVGALHHQAILMNYPREWQRRYVEGSYHRSDPILAWGRHHAVAFNWSEVYRGGDMTIEERRVLDEAAQFGLKDGISVPFHGPHGRIAIVSFVDRETHGTDDDKIGYLQAAGYQFHAAFSRMLRGAGSVAVPELSRRERECLLWAAEGKSSWETGKIVGISENTVIFHIKRAMQKFDTGSRTVAIVKAIRLGLLA